jgi:hypothetical protein
MRRSCRAVVLPFQQGLCETAVMRSRKARIDSPSDDSPAGRLGDARFIAEARARVRGLECPGLGPGARTSRNPARPALSSQGCSRHTPRAGAVNGSRSVVCRSVERNPLRSRRSRVPVAHARVHLAALTAAEGLNDGGAGKSEARELVQVGREHCLSGQRVAPILHVPSASLAWYTFRRTSPSGGAL